MDKKLARLGTKTWRLLTVDEAAAEFPIPRPIIEEWFAAGDAGLFLKGKLWQMGHHTLGDQRYIAETDLLALIEARREPRPQDVWKIPRERLERHRQPSPALPDLLR